MVRVMKLSVFTQALNLSWTISRNITFCERAQHSTESARANSFTKAADGLNRFSFTSLD